MSEDSKSLLEGLLQRDISLRLKDPSKIKDHAFFKSIDFNALYNKKIKPFFIPDVVCLFSPEFPNDIEQKGEHDVSQIDPMFVKEAPNISPSQPNNIDVADQSNFEGFTYVNESNMGKA